MAIDRGGSGVASAGPGGLLTDGDLPDGTPGHQDALGIIEPPGPFGDAPARPVAPVTPLAPSVSPAAPAPPGWPALEGPAGRSPCGTGWPEGPRRGTGWPGGSALPAAVPAGGQARPSARRERACALAGQLGSVPVARDFARATVRGWGLPELTDDVASVVSELVTNALRYGLAGHMALIEVDEGPAAPAEADGGPVAPIEVRLMLRPADVLCMVADPGAGVPALTEAGHYAEGGRGLHVVASCSDRWGWDQLAGGGKVVWAAFRR